MQLMPNSHIIQYFAKYHAILGEFIYFSTTAWFDFMIASIALSSKSVTCSKKHERQSQLIDM
jgi:hypothetical protein